MVDLANNNFVPCLLLRNITSTDKHLKRFMKTLQNFRVFLISRFSHKTNKLNIHSHGMLSFSIHDADFVSGGVIEFNVLKCFFFGEFFTGSTDQQVTVGAVIGRPWQ